MSFNLLSVACHHSQVKVQIDIKTFLMHRIGPTQQCPVAASYINEREDSLKLLDRYFMHIKIHYTFYFGCMCTSQCETKQQMVFLLGGWSACGAAAAEEGSVVNRTTVEGRCQVTAFEDTSGHFSTLGECLRGVWFFIRIVALFSCGCSEYDYNTTFVIIRLHRPKSWEGLSVETQLGHSSCTVNRSRLSFVRPTIHWLHEIMLGQQ